MIEKKCFQSVTLYKANFRDEVKYKFSISFYKIIFIRRTRPPTQCKLSCTACRQLVIVQTTFKRILMPMVKEKKEKKKE